MYTKNIETSRQHNADPNNEDILKNLRDKAMKFLSDQRCTNISEEEISKAVKLMFVGYSSLINRHTKQKTNSKTQNLNLGIITSEWGQTS